MSAMLSNEPTLIIVMGPAGCGKSTIGAALSQSQGWPLIEGDDFHSAANKAKQARGEPLTDADRASWIDAIVDHANARTAPVCVLACSALTPYVQSRLAREISRPIQWMHLDVPAAILKRRLEARTDHFMPASLLGDQLAALVIPPQAMIIRADGSVEKTVEAIIRRLNLAR